MEAAIDSSVRRAFGITDIHLNINGIFDGVGRDRLGNGDKNLVHLRYNKWQIYELNSEGNPNPTIDIQNPILSQLFTWELIPIDTDGPIVPNDEPPPGYGP